MSGWFQAQIVHTGRLPLFCFFVAFVLGFGFIRLSVRLIRAQVRWWPGNVTTGDVHVHHMVFGVVFMTVGGVTELAAPLYSLGWRSAAAALFGLGTALLLMGITPVGVKDLSDYQRLLPVTPGVVTTLHLAAAALFLFASVTLLKGKIWTGLFGLFVPLLFIAGAFRLARPGSPWARWRYRNRPGKQARADRREQRLRQPVVRAKIRIQDLLAGGVDQQPAPRERQPAPGPGPGREG